MPISGRSVARLPSIDAVHHAVINCKACSRLIEHCQTVANSKTRRFEHWTYWGRPVPGFGDAGARLLIVGLAPAAHGANRTGRMFTGDSSGDWLYDALHQSGFANQPLAVDRTDGLRLIDCYISAAARCAPPQNRPTTTELETCRPFLEAELRLLTRVKVVLALGHIAFDAVMRAARWREQMPAALRPKFGHGVETRMPNGQTLICSYHPSRQNTNTGKLTRAMWLDIFHRAERLVSVS